MKKTPREDINELLKRPLRLTKEIIRSPYYKVNKGEGDRIVLSVNREETLSEEDYLYIHRCRLSTEAESFAAYGPEGVDYQRLAKMAEDRADEIPLD